MSTDPAGALVIVALALTGVAAVLLPPWRAARRRRRLELHTFPSGWDRILRRRVPLYRRLPAALRPRLHAAIQIFLAEKQFYGCDGFVVTDAVRLTIAAQACVLIANRPAPYYPQLRSILVYPGEFVVPIEAVDAAGVHAVSTEVRSGESWGSGRVVFSWEDVRRGALVPDDGYNVVVHEFAHQLDVERGGVDGAPALADAAAARRWTEVFSAEYAEHERRTARGEDTVIDPYGTHSPGEFFATATEAFLERPRELAREHAALYAVLRDFYALDPATWV
ncbi:MAG: zinc-dependent peptidase [Gammaproteobacteria bacterium]|nr:zinc-dependent peptidase [Gammaproteobacteria bacterium]